MDRNAVLAVILISIIMTVWLVWFSPQPPESRPPQESEMVDSLLVTDDQAADETEEAPEQELSIQPPPIIDSVYVAATQGEARDIRVKTEVYEAILSTKGATLTSLILKDYKQFDQATPVQIIDTTSPGALSVEFVSPTNHLLSSSEFYFETDQPDDIEVSGAEPTEVSFETQIGEGTLRLIYTFYPDSYEVGLSVEQENAESYQSRTGYEIVWNGGVPFAEETGSQEARVAGAFVRSGGEVEKLTLNKEPADRLNLGGSIEWMAVRNGFFAAYVIPDGETRGAEMEGVRTDAPDGTVLGHTYQARLLVPFPDEGRDGFRLYLGPIDFAKFRRYGLGLYEIVDYGFGQGITRPISKYLIIPVFHHLSNWVNNFGLIIIIFAFLIKLLLYPLTKSSFKSMAQMRQLQPKMTEIKEKYGDDPQKQQQAMMKLYKESGVNPVGGCLPQLLQLPILYALFRFFPAAIEIRQQGFLWCTDLSAPDVLTTLPFALPVYGAHVSGFPLLMAAAMVLQMQLQGTTSQTGQMKVMMYVMPVFILVIFNQFAAGLSLYYLMYNILSAIQQKFINRSLEQEKESEQEVAQARKKAGRTAASRSTPSSKKQRPKQVSGRRPKRRSPKG